MAAPVRTKQTSTAGGTMLPMQTRWAPRRPRPPWVQKTKMDAVLRSRALVKIVIEEPSTADSPDESNGLSVAFEDWAPPMPRVYIVDTIEKLARCLQLLRPARLAYVTAKGHFCSREGSMSILQIWLENDQCFFIDIVRLSKAVFHRALKDGFCLASWLADASVTKVVFDVRNLADALWYHSAVALGGVEDLQLMQLSACPADRQRTLPGLSQSFLHCPAVSHSAAQMAADLKSEFTSLFVTTHKQRAKYDIDARPVTEMMALYCIYDVYLFPALYNHHKANQNDQQARRIAAGTNYRLLEALGPCYEPYAKERIFAPPRWQLDNIPDFIYWKPPKRHMVKANSGGSRSSASLSDSDVRRSSPSSGSSESFPPTPPSGLAEFAIPVPNFEVEKDLPGTTVL